MMSLLSATFVREFSMADIPHGTSSGYNYWGCRCDVCVGAKRERDRAYYVANLQKPKKPPKYATASERMKAWREANPEKAKAIRARERTKYRDKRKADALARYYRLMADDPEAVRARRRAQAKTEKGVLANRAARHRRRGAAPTPEGLVYMTVLAGDPCCYCGGPAEETDHITPVIRGGDGDWSNMTSACRSCNAKKNDKTLLGFLMEGAMHG